MDRVENAGFSPKDDGAGINRSLQSITTRGSAGGDRDLMQQERVAMDRVVEVLPDRIERC